MNATKAKRVIFKTIEDYRLYYAAPDDKKRARHSKYYRIGEDLARMACERSLKDRKGAGGANT